MTPPPSPPWHDCLMPVSGCLGVQEEFVKLMGREAAKTTHRKTLTPLDLGTPPHNAMRCCRVQACMGAGSLTLKSLSAGAQLLPPSAAARSSFCSLTLATSGAA